MTPCGSTLSVAIHLTHNCNLRCSYCYTGEKFGWGMDSATVDRAVDFALEQAAAQQAEHLEIVFFGGEPLLRKDALYRVADRATERARGVRVSFKMSTNGLLLDDETIGELDQRQVFVSLSIDGPPEVQDRQRPDAAGHATGARLQEVIPRLLAWNPCTAVNCVIVPETAAKLDGSVRWLFGQGLAYVSTALDVSAAWDWGRLDELRRAYERLADWYVDRTLAGDKLYLSCFDERINTRTRGPLQRTERCSIGYRQFSIAPSGRLYPCVQFVRDDRDPTFAIGDIWNGFREPARSALASCSEAGRPECDGCMLLDRCSSWCACVNWQSTGRLDQASPIVCEHERLLMPIADRAANRLWRARNRTFLHKHYNPAFPVLEFAERVMIEEDCHGGKAPVSR
jgi:uncharacterized protein